jgi:predicted GIY-YIG superfamily endonuclease
MNDLLLAYAAIMQVKQAMDEEFSFKREVKNNKKNRKNR